MQLRAYLRRRDLRPSPAAASCWRLLAAQLLAVVEVSSTSGKRIDPLSVLPCWCIVVAAAAAASAAAAGAAGSKPHIVFVLQDDAGHYDYGFSGNTNNSAVTATISALARGGIILAHHYTHWHCSPTRRSFLTGRLPVHHHEQLSGVATDDVDLRYATVGAKLKQAGYATHWYGKGHTGYRSMAHLPTRRGFDRFMGFLSGSQSYTADDRWEGEHPVRDDAQFVHPPPDCRQPADEWRRAAEREEARRSGDGPATADTDTTAAGGTAGATAGAACTMIASFANTTLSGAIISTAPAAGINACQAACCAVASCSHLAFDDGAAAAAPGSCALFSGCVVQHVQAGSTAQVHFHPPTPAPSPPSSTSCAASYSTNLYGKLAVEAIAQHDASSAATPLFLYLAFQAVHAPYDKVPGWNATAACGKMCTYQGMLNDADLYVGKIVAALKANGNMWANTLFVYSSDNGGTGAGVNYPLRGEKHTNWEGGMRTAAFVAGGLVPAALRGSTSTVNLHIVE